MTTQIINGQVDRPRPSARWAFGTSWFGNHEWYYEVGASYAADTTRAIAPGWEQRTEEEQGLLPNNITVVKKLNGPHSKNGEVLRFTREGATALRDALELALAWDGQ